MYLSERPPAVNRNRPETLSLCKDNTFFRFHTTNSFLFFQTAPRKDGKKWMKRPILSMKSAFFAHSDLNHHLQKSPISPLKDRTSFQQIKLIWSPIQLDLLCESSTMKKQIQWIYSSNSVNLLIKFSEFGHQFQWICLKRVSLLEPITSFSDTLTGHSQISLTHIRHSFHTHPTSSLLPCPAATDVFFTNKLLVEKLGKQILFSYICKQQVYIKMI